MNNHNPFSTNIDWEADEEKFGDLPDLFHKPQSFPSPACIKKSRILVHPASINLLTDATWEFARNTLWKRFPFYEREIEIYKNHIRQYYENIPVESFAETAYMNFVSYCVRILLTRDI